MDLLDVMDAHKRVNAQNTLDRLNTLVMSHTTDAEGFKRYASELQREAGYGQAESTPEFDKAGFERLKMKMKLGL